MSEKEMQDFQAQIKFKFGQLDKSVSKHKFMSILMEEVGEVAKAVLSNDPKSLEAEFADLFFVTISMANKFNIDLSAAFKSKILDADPEKLIQKWA